MFDWLTELVSASAWTYPIVLRLVALDAFFPLVPSETIVITAGVAAYVTALGYFGREAFKDSSWKPLLFSFAVAAAVAGGGEIARRLGMRRARRARSDRNAPDELVRG
jgi:membrane-associated protein